MVHFRVQKGSAFAFECCSDAAQRTQSGAIKRLFTRAEDLDALQIEEVSISKRLDLGDVERMITLCQQHPPQCVVGPALPEHAAAFREFTAYLEKRQRAGVATLPSGYLLLLTPIPNRDEYLRCLVIKSKSSEVDAESVSSHSSVRSEGEETSITIATRSSSSITTINGAARSQPSGAKPQSQKLLSLANRIQQEQSAHSSNAKHGETPTSGVHLSRDARFAQLREEHRAFSLHHHQILQEWISR